MVTLRLEIRAIGTADFRAFIPVDTEPAEAVEDRLQRFGSVAFGVGVINAEDELPAHPPCQQPIEQGGADAADVQVPGWARCETGADRHTNRIWMPPACV